MVAREAGRLVFFVPGARREGPLRRWAVSCQPFARALWPPSETALGDRSHAVSLVRSVVERRKTSKMRLLAGFWPFKLWTFADPCTLLEESSVLPLR